jgi:hypothetical protein
VAKKRKQHPLPLLRPLQPPLRLKPLLQQHLRPLPTPLLHLPLPPLLTQPQHLPPLLLLQTRSLKRRSSNPSASIKKAALAAFFMRKNAHFRSSTSSFAIFSD